MCREGGGGVPVPCIVTVSCIRFRFTQINYWGYLAKTWNLCTVVHLLHGGVCSILVGERVKNPLARSVVLTEQCAVNDNDVTVSLELRTTG